MVASRDARRRAKETTEKPAIQTITKPIGGEKNGGVRTVILNKGPKWYPADDVKKPVPSRKHVHKPTKLRPSITPGTVLILLGGPFRGSRVVFLKQLSSGSLLVTGPYTVNGVPLRRVDQAYVIATSTKVDVSAADVSKLDDDFFKRNKVQKKKDVMETDDSEENKKKKKKPVSEEKIAAQKSVDAVLVPVIEKVPHLTSYLKSKFSLKKGHYPHEMVF